MKRTILIGIAAVLVICTTLYAANGDLIVNGNISTGGQLQALGGGDVTIGFNTGNKLNLGGVMTVLGTGNVGIGTTAPDVKLRIHYGTDQNLRFGNTGTTAYLLSTNDAWSLYNPLQLNGIPILLNPDGGGNVGIGMTNPDSYARLTVSGRSDLYGSGNDSSNFGLVVYNNNGVANLVVRNDAAVGIGTSNPGTYKLYVAGPIWYNGGGNQGSDLRLKKDIQPINDPLIKLLNLNGVSYEWRTSEYKDKNLPEGRHYGVIAQEIEKVLPEVVNVGPDGMKGVAYTEIIPVLIEAMKEQQKKIDQLERKITELENR